MAVLGIHQPRIEAPLNHNTSTASTAHAVAAILGVVDFGPLYHDAAMTAGHTSDRSHKADIYNAGPESTRESEGKWTRRIFIA